MSGARRGSTLNGRITAKVAQLGLDQTILDKVAGGYVVSDTAANVAAGLSALAADAVHIASIAVTSGVVTGGDGLFVADRAALDKISGGFSITSAFTLNVT